MNKYFTYRDGKLYWKVSPNSSIKVGDICNTKNRAGYVRVGLNRKRFLAHRVIWEMFNGAIPEGMQVDHVNGIKDDNRIENLQLLTHKQNLQRKNYSKGYSYYKDNHRVRPYKAHKTFNDKQHYLGYYGTPCGAYMANRMFFVNR